MSSQENISWGGFAGCACLIHSSLLACRTQLLPLKAGSSKLRSVTSHCVWLIVRMQFDIRQSPHWVWRLYVKGLLSICHLLPLQLQLWKRDRMKVGRTTPFRHGENGRETAVSWLTCVLNGNCLISVCLNGACCLIGFNLGWVGGEQSPLNVIHHLICQTSVQSSSRVSEGRGLLLCLEPFFYIISWLHFFFFFCFIPSILALQSTLSSRNLLKSHPLMISVP